MAGTGILQNPLTNQFLTPTPPPNMDPTARFQYYLDPQTQLNVKQHAIDAMRRSAAVPNPGGSNAYGGGRGPDYFSGQSAFGPVQGNATVWPGQGGAGLGGMGGGGFWGGMGGGQGQPEFRAGQGEATAFDPSTGFRAPGTGLPGPPHGFGVGGGDPNALENISANFGTYNDIGFYGGPSGGRLPWHSLYQSFDPRLNYAGPGPYTLPNITHPLLGLLGQFLNQPAQGGMAVPTQPPAR